MAQGRGVSGRWGLPTRMGLVLVALVLGTSLAVAGVIFSRLERQLVRSAELRLEHATESQQGRLVATLKELNRDVKLLAGTPPIGGIVRARNNGGIDPVDGSTEAAWKDRLTTIFRQTLLVKPYYLQVRYLDASGMETVRAQRSGGKVVVVPEAELQDKSGEPYVAGTLRMPIGAVYHSKFNLNREHGEIEKPPVPVVRAAVPTGPASTPAGMVVINLSLAEALADLEGILGPGQDFYLLNAEGFFLRHPDAKRTFEFERGAQSPRGWTEFPKLRRLSVNAPSLADTHDGHMVAMRRVQLERGDTDAHVYLVVTGALDQATAVATTTFKQVVGLIAGLVIAALAIGVWLARWVSAPVVRLAAAVRHASEGGTRPVLPAGLSGEAGELAAALDGAFDALEARTHQVHARNRELEQFVYIASHDLQEPLRTVTSFAEILEQEAKDSLSEDGRQALRFIPESCARMRELVRGLTDYGRIGERGAETQVALADLVSEVRTDLAESIRASEVDLRVGDMPEIIGLRAELRSLLQNLIANAIKYRRTDRASVVEVEGGWDAGQAWFAVTDNGIGIAPEHRAAVFRIFHRLHRREAYPGTGIGLAHCYKIVQLHGGTIHVEDGMDGGSRFVVRLGARQGKHQRSSTDFQSEVPND